jgi:sortase A
VRRVAPGILLVLGLAQMAQGGWIHAKACLAQVLLEDAWQMTLVGGREVRPWPWADTWPVARLRAPEQNADLIVLEGASGRVIAFAPGWLHGSARPGQPGACVIAGHRDTHFAILEDLDVGDPLLLEDATATVHEYRVTGSAVVDRRDVGALECSDENCLVLVTCWPFDAIRPGGPERYVVWAAGA